MTMNEFEEFVAKRLAEARYQKHPDLVAISKRITEAACDLRDTNTAKELAEFVDLIQMEIKHEDGDGPDSVTVDGVKHYGPVVDAYHATLRVILGHLNVLAGRPRDYDIRKVKGVY